MEKIYIKQNGEKYYDYSNNHADKINHKTNESDIELDELDNYPEIKIAYEKKCNIEDNERKIRKAIMIMKRIPVRVFLDDYEAQRANNNKWKLILHNIIIRYKADVT
jgi:hypothetical protein